MAQMCVLVPSLDWVVHTKVKATWFNFNLHCVRWSEISRFRAQICRHLGAQLKSILAGATAIIITNDDPVLRRDAKKKHKHIRRTNRYGENIKTGAGNLYLPWVMPAMFVFPSLRTITVLGTCLDGFPVGKRKLQLNESSVVPIFNWAILVEKSVLSNSISACNILTDTAYTLA